MHPFTKGQAQMGELVMVMIIFFILVGFGLIFYTKYTQGEVNKAVSDIDRANLAETAKIVSSLPEIHYSYAGDEDLSSIDTEKAKVFATRLAGPDRLQYSELFHGYKAQVHCIYPSCSEDIQLFDYTDQTKPNSQEFLLPIFIYDPLTLTRNYGTLTITQYS